MPDGEQTVHPRRTLYGRRHGRARRPGRQLLLDTLLPRLRIDLEPQLGPVDLPALFGRPVPAAWLEVGFGAGEHLLDQAGANPEIAIIGVEPYVDGVARLLAGIAAQKLDNVRILTDDAALLLDLLPAASIVRAFVLFPDPWPKRRHHRRRFVSPANLDALARALADGAELRLATDDVGYMEWMLALTAAHTAFAWQATRQADWRVRPADWPATRYEAKAIAAGRLPYFFRFVRRARGELA